jgi:NhaP-type Na+/H+ or K+/H+ antiporter
LNFEHWYILVGVLMVAMALGSAVLRRLPLTTSMPYLLVGIALGPLGFGVLVLDPEDNAALLERASEFAVIVSLFVAGLQLTPPLRDRRWWIPLRLAFGSMALTVGLITLVGVTLLDLPLGVAVLLGAVLAPTDPVLASDVQVENPWDRDRLRFGLTGEAGLNDGTAFPFVMLGLGLIGLHDLGAGGWKWWVVDVAWAIVGGLAIGAIIGRVVGWAAVRIQQRRPAARELNDFLALGLLGATYGLALTLHTYGFLAAFTLGLALRRVGNANDPQSPVSVLPAQHADPARPDAIDPRHVPAEAVRTALGFLQQLERLAELAMVVLLGAVLLPRYFLDGWWFVLLLLLVIRPLAVWIGLLGAEATRLQRGLFAWFGIRGIGSIYYLMYAITHGLPEPYASRLDGLTLATIATSIVLHGLSVTPLMNRYEKAGRREDDAAATTT